MRRSGVRFPEAAPSVLDTAMAADGRIGLRRVKAARCARRAAVRVLARCARCAVLASPGIPASGELCRDRTHRLATYGPIPGCAQPEGLTSLYNHAECG